MKRYLLFAGEVYYPSGGWEDFHSSHDTLEEAREIAAIWKLIEAEIPWAHVVDSTTWKVVPDA